MGFTSFRINVVARLALLSALVFVAIWGSLNTDWEITPVVCAVLAAAVAIELIRYVESVNRELTAFLDFVAHRDFSVGLPIGEKGKVFKRLESAYALLMRKFRELNQEKAANYQYLESLVEHVSTALLCLDGEGNVRLMNEQAKRLFNVPYLPSIRSLRRLDPELPQRLEELHDGDRTLVNISIEGEPLQLAVFVTEFELLGQTYKLVSFQNIRDELEQREVDFSQKLIRVMTHEIMNSVTPIIALSKVIEESLLKSGDLQDAPEGLTPEDREDLLRGAASIQSRGSGLLRFVKAYGTLTNLPRPKASTIHVATLLEQVSTLMAPTLQSNAIKLETDIAEPDLALRADSEQIQQVLINLVKNATEALADRRDGRIVLRAARDAQGSVLVQVVDNGPGIEESQLDNVFVPFFTTKRSGTGVGLSLSRQIMFLNKGLISVKTTPGAGCEFTLKFR